jgi:hypothetical protein
LQRPTSCYMRCKGGHTQQALHLHAAAVAAALLLATSAVTRAARHLAAADQRWAALQHPCTHTAAGDRVLLVSGAGSNGSGREWHATPATHTRTHRVPNHTTHVHDTTHLHESSQPRSHSLPGAACAPAWQLSCSCRATCCRSAWYAWLACSSGGASVCPVSHLNRSGFSCGAGRWPERVPQCVCRNGPATASGCGAVCTGFCHA